MPAMAQAMAAQAAAKFMLPGMQLMPGLGMVHPMRNMLQMTGMPMVPPAASPALALSRPSMQTAPSACSSLPIAEQSLVDDKSKSLTTVPSGDADGRRVEDQDAINSEEQNKQRDLKLEPDGEQLSGAQQGQPSDVPQDGALKEASPANATVVGLLAEVPGDARSDAALIGPASDTLGQVQPPESLAPTNVSEMVECLRPVGQDLSEKTCSGGSIVPEAAIPEIEKMVHLMIQNKSCSYVSRLSFPCQPQQHFVNSARQLQQSCGNLASSLRKMSQSLLLELLDKH